MRLNHNKQPFGAVVRISGKQNVLRWFVGVYAMKTSSLCLAIVVSMVVLAVTAPAQTACGIEHTGTGIFICYPHPPSKAAESLPELFHISAQANAPNGAIIRRYSVFLDNELLYDNRLAIPVQRLSIELNLRAPLKPGPHMLRIMVPQTGTVDLKNIEFHPSPAAGFCDPISTVESLSACHPVIPSLLNWSVNTGPDAATDSLSLYWQYLRLYAHNLKSTEADIADAAAVDSHGNFYIALHVFAGLEIRRYSPNRSVTYDTVVQTCGRGRVSVSGLAVRDDGRIWAAGNTTACLPGTAGAWKPKVTDPSRPHGFVLSLDTAKPTSTSPVYLTYLADADNDISGMRVDAAGNVYVTGAALSSFPHQHSFALPDMKSPPANATTGFVSALNPSGTILLWSSLIMNTELAHLAVGRSGDVYVTGRTSDRSDAFLLNVSENGSKLSFTLPLSKGDPRAIAVTHGDTPILISGERMPSGAGSEKFVMAIDACTRHVIGSDASPADENDVGLEVSRRLALDTFAAVLSSGDTKTCGSAALSGAR